MFGLFRFFVVGCVVLVDLLCAYCWFVWLECCVCFVVCLLLDVCCFSYCYLLVSLCVFVGLVLDILFAGYLVFGFLYIASIAC